MSERGDAGRDGPGEPPPPREIERKFLATLPPDRDPGDARGTGAPSPLAGAERVEMEQVYARTTDPQVRIRRAGDAYTLTVKQGSGLVRIEHEQALEPRLARFLLRELETGVRKVRYRKGRWEVDVYGGHLEGLVVAEVELEAEDEPLPKPPEGVRLGRELTEDLRFTAASLAPMDGKGAAELIREAREGG